MWLIMSTSAGISLAVTSYSAVESLKHRKWVCGVLLMAIKVYLASQGHAATAGSRRRGAPGALTSGAD